MPLLNAFGFNHTTRFQTSVTQTLAKLHPFLDFSQLFNRPLGKGETMPIYLFSPVPG